MCWFTSARTVVMVFARSAGSAAMYCAGVLTFDAGFMDSSSSQTKCVTGRLKTSQRQGLWTDGDRREVSLSLKCPVIMSQASLAKQISENVPSVPDFVPEFFRRAAGPFHVRVVGLPGLAPSQTPQSARREDEGEAPEPAERPECPDEEEAAGGLGDLAVMCPPHVDDGHACREQPDEQHDDVPRSPFGEHQRPVQQHHENGQRNV